MLGITFWQLCHGCEEPFARVRSSGELRRELTRALELNRKASASLRCSDGAPQPMVDLIGRMCSISAELRPTAAEVCGALTPHVRDDFAELLAKRQASEDEGSASTGFDRIIEEYTHANEVVGDTGTSMKASISVCESIQGKYAAVS